MKENGKAMTLFTAVVCVILTGMMAFAFVYLLNAPDFVPPTAPPASQGPETSIWDCSVEDMIDFLDAQGFLNKDEYDLMVEIGTENRIYNGIDFIWWDVENLAEGTEAYKNWQQISNDGYILIGDSIIYSPILNGPFAICATEDFPGDTDALYAAFSSFTGNAGGEPAKDPVWEKSVDDMIAYLDEKGFLNKDEYDLMVEIGTENRIYNGIDFIWWDVENLTEGTEAYKNWQQISNDGYILIGDSIIYSPILNGPFAICATEDFPGDTDALYAAFAAFPD